MAYTFKHGDRPLDDYTIQRAVGAGGFGEVYYAVSDGGREVALKYLKSNPQIELRGVSHCINLKSPHLVSIFDVKKNADDEYFIIMEYCSGPSLRDLLVAEPNGFDPQKAAFFAREIAKGLAYLHDRGIVHRDLKPGNIFYDDGYVKIGDYGLSKFISVSRHSAQTASVGTVHYMAPEIGSGNYSRGVDIYALGVILYEMLLGKVPFEGSSMGEVLMKHLTARPELDELPHSFGKVIRGSLEKDPKDRYQSVDAMLDELLEADEVKQSLAGFSTKSLEGAIRQGGGEGAPSPIPSPNPMPGYARDFARADSDDVPHRFEKKRGASALPKRLSRRMERIARKLDRKVAKLSGRSVGPARPPHEGRDARPTETLAATDLPTRGKRISLAVVLSMGLVVGLGVIAGNATQAEAGVSASMLVLALAGGVLLSRRAINWFGVSDEPRWPSRLIQVGCCTPLLSIGAAPMLAETEEGLAVWLGLLTLAIFANWSKDLSRNGWGRISWGTALWTALGAMILTGIAGGITDRDVEGYVMVSAGVGGVTSLVLQAWAWAMPFAEVRKPRRPQDSGSGRFSGKQPPDDDDVAVFGVAIGGDWGAAKRTSAPSDGGTRSTLQRGAVSRGFWGIVAFVMMSIVIVLSLVLGIEPLRYDERTGVIIGIIAASSAMIFSIRKMTPLRRPGLWRESFRPLILCILMFSVGALTTGMVRHGNLVQIRQVGLSSHAFSFGDGADAISVYMDMSPHPEERVVMLSGLVISAILLIGITLFTGRKPRPPQPFLRESGAMDEPAAASSNPSVDADNAPRPTDEAI